MTFFYTHLASLRISAGLTQGELAECLGISQQAVQNWEAGRNKPKNGMVPLIARALRCGVEEISDLQEQPSFYEDEDTSQLPDELKKMLQAWPHLPADKQQAMVSIARVVLADINIPGKAAR